MTEQFEAFNERPFNLHQLSNPYASASSVSANERIGKNNFKSLARGKNLIERLYLEISIIATELNTHRAELQMTHEHISEHNSLVERIECDLTKILQQGA